MSLKETILQEQNAATRARNTLKINTLRMLRAAIKNREVERRTELNDQEVIGIIRTQIKQRKEAIDQFKGGGRKDLAEKEEQELAVLMSFMPEQLSEEATARIAAQVIEELGAKDLGDMGKVMKTLMGRLAGSVDGKVVSEVVRKQLGS